MTLEEVVRNELRGELQEFYAHEQAELRRVLNKRAADIEKRYALGLKRIEEKLDLIHESTARIEMRQLDEIHGEPF